MNRWPLLRALLPALLCSALLSACSLPSLEGRTTSQALPIEQAAQTRLGTALAPLLVQHPGQSGIHTLSDAHDAFAARALLAQAAERTLDVQYYIWRNDTTGHLLFDQLRVAADRGVRVRLLLDDGGTSGLDAQLAALDQHPQIEVRLFNPFVVRTPKYLGYLTDFSRTQRRMHNKGFTADNQASIVGGRNVGDEYFAATDGVLFADLDVVAVGPVVADISQEFDRYWASASAYPVSSILPALPDYAVERAYAALVSDLQRPESQAYVQAIAKSRFTQDLLAGQLPLYWAKSTLVSDDPGKVLGDISEEGLLITQLAPVIGQPLRNVDLISPYFVPTKSGVEALARLTAQGVNVRVLTNSIEATDVAVVHAGYAKYRKPLLQQGVHLYELRSQISRLDFPSTDKPSKAAAPKATAPRAAPSPAALGGGSSSFTGSSGSSGASLHAKTFAIDGTRLFVGSFNFDPRSAHLNTELGLVIESPELTQLVTQTLDTALPHTSYKVQLTPQGKLSWTTLDDSHPPQPITTTTEPGSSWLKRFMLRVMGWLPIEGFL